MTLANLNRQLAQAIAHTQLQLTCLNGVRLYLIQTQGLSEIKLSPSAINRLWQKMPYWAFAWASGRALAEFIQSNPKAVKNKSVLELGIGSGLVAISAAMAGAKRVYIQDLDPLAHQAAHLNAALNQQTLHDWQHQSVDLLLASDLLYDINSHHSLQTLMADIPEYLLAEPKTAVHASKLSLTSIHNLRHQTFPVIQGFDDALEITILQGYKSA